MDRMDTFADRDGVVADTCHEGARHHQLVLQWPRRILSILFILSGRCFRFFVSRFGGRATRVVLSCLTGPRTRVDGRRGVGYGGAEFEQFDSRSRIQTFRFTAAVDLLMRPVRRRPVVVGAFDGAHTR